MPRLRFLSLSSIEEQVLSIQTRNGYRNVVKRFPWIGAKRILNTYGSEDEEMFFCQEYKVIICILQQKKLQIVMPVYFPHCSKRIQTKMK